MSSSSSSSSTSMSDNLVHAVIAGAIAYAESKATGLTGQVRLPILGITDVSNAMGASTAAATVASNFLEQYVLPLLPQDDAFVKAENMWLGPVLSGLSGIGILKFSDSAELDSIGMGKVFFVGALADVAADYIHKNFVVSA